MSTLFSHVCQERDGQITRHVAILDPRDSVLIEELIERMWKVPTFLPVDPELARRMFQASNSIFFLVDSVGIVAVQDVSLGLAAHVHVTFWDRKLRGREGLCRKLAQYVMQRFGLVRLFTWVPETMPTVAAFAERVGFERRAWAKGVIALEARASEMLHDATTGGV